MPYRDAMKLPIKVHRRHQCLDCGHTWDAEFQESTCRRCGSNKLNVTDILKEETPK